MLVQIAILLFLLSWSIQLFKSYRSPNLPRVGPPTIFGYVWTAMRFTFSLRPIIEGREKFSGQPFIIPTFNGPVTVLGPEYLELLQHSNDTVFSQPAAVNETLTFRQTLSNCELNFGDAYHVTVLRTDLTRALPSWIPDIFDEITLAMEETLNPPDGSDSITIPIFEKMTYLTSRIVNRVLVGSPHCRDPKYVHAMVQFAEGVVLYSHILKMCPVRLRNSIYFILSSLLGGKKDALKFLVPVVEGYLRTRKDTEDKLHTLAEFFVRAAPPAELSDPSGIAMLLMHMNFASIHTTSLFLTHTLFELAVLPQEQRDEIREEVQDAIAEEGGWNKESLAMFHKLDSLLREVGRFHGLTTLALPRITIQDGTLPDGTLIPLGNLVAIDLKRVHMNPEIYPNPEVFDPFRFSNLRDGDGADMKNNKFATVDKNYLVFGLGRHACAGRFLASAQIKLMLSYILLHYDFELPGGVTTRRPTTSFQGFVVPDIKGKLVFKRR